VLGNLSVFPLLILLLTIGAIGIPLVAVSRAASRRRMLRDSGELVITDRTNTLAIVGFVLSFVAAVPGIVLSHVALSQIRRTSDQGWGLAVAGLWIGYIVVGVFALFILLPGVAGVIVKAS
jgi:hypothetical protein